MWLTALTRAQLSILNQEKLLFQDEFLDVIYWMRQIMGVVLGLLWGLIPLKGILGIAL